MILIHFEIGILSEFIPEKPVFMDLKEFISFHFTFKLLLEIKET